MNTTQESADVAGIVADVADILTTDCYISTPTQSIGAAGGRASTWTDSAVIKCRVSQVSNRDALIFQERLANTIGWSVLLPYSTTISAGCRVKVGSDTYEVIGVRYNVTMPTWKRAICVEVK